MSTGQFWQTPTQLGATARWVETLRNTSGYAQLPGNGHVHTWHAANGTTIHTRSTCGHETVTRADTADITELVNNQNLCGSCEWHGSHQVTLTNPQVQAIASFTLAIIAKYLDLVEVLTNDDELNELTSAGPILTIEDYVRTAAIGEAAQALDLWLGGYGRTAEKILGDQQGYQPEFRRALGTDSTERDAIAQMFETLTAQGHQLLDDVAGIAQRRQLADKAARALVLDSTLDVADERTGPLRMHIPRTWTEAETHLFKQGSSIEWLEQLSYTTRPAGATPTNHGPKVLDFATQFNGYVPQPAAHGTESERQGPWEAARDTYVANVATYIDTVLDSSDPTLYAVCYAKDVVNRGVGRYAPASLVKPFTSNTLGHDVRRDRVVLATAGVAHAMARNQHLVAPIGIDVAHQDEAELADLLVRMWAAHNRKTRSTNVEALAKEWTSIVTAATAALGIDTHPGVSFNTIPGANLALTAA